MSLIEVVASLQELEKVADKPPWKYVKGKSGWTNDMVEDSQKGIMWWGNIADDDAIHLTIELRNAAPDLFKVLAGFQPGDADTLLWMTVGEGEEPSQDQIADVLLRFQIMASLMEASSR